MPLVKAKPHHPRRKVLGKVNNWQMLVDAIMEEDSLLRERLAQCPQEVRDIKGPHGALSFKETLGHIAFWDSFTVDFFSNKLDKTCLDPSPLVNFEERSIEALETASQLPFGEVLARYLEATGSLTNFLGRHWGDLSPREKHDFWVPLKHRRHHRISLFQALDDLLSPNEMAAEA
jgi:hypothetical protein